MSRILLLSQNQWTYRLLPVVVQFLLFQTDAKISFKTKKVSSSLYPYSFCRWSKSRSNSAAYLFTSTVSWYAARTGYFLLHAFVQLILPAASSLVLSIISWISFTSMSNSISSSSDKWYKTARLLDWRISGSVSSVSHFEIVCLLTPPVFPQPLPVTNLFSFSLEINCFPDSYHCLLFVMCHHYTVKTKFLLPAQWYNSARFINIHSIREEIIRYILFISFCQFY